MTRSSSQKHFGIHLDEKLNFIYHIKEKIPKANKGIGVIKKLNNTLPRKALLTLYKPFVRSHLDYGDIIYDQLNNESFCNKLETVQYNAALAITGSIQGTSKVKLYKELGFESLKSRRWFRCLCCFYEYKTFGLPSYLSNLISSGVHSCNTRNSEDVVTYCCRDGNFKYSFFPWTILEWNKLDLILCKSYKIFRNSLLKMVCPYQILCMAFTIH